MPVATSTIAPSDKSNTVAVVPLPDAYRGSTFLRTAASNLIHAIAQGSTTAAAEAHHDGHDEDQGSSSFTYSAPSLEHSQSAWYTQVPWHISNRYYEVDVTLKAYSPELLSSNTPHSASGTLSDIPAYIVLVDRSRPLEEHHRNIKQIESAVASGFDADISIVAGLSTFTSSSTQVLTGLEESGSAQKDTVAPSVSDLVTLYADAGWEFIAIDDEDDSDNESESSIDPEESAEQDGIDRIREALQNHMWNGLCRKEDPKAAAALTRSSAEEPTPGPHFSSLGFSSAHNQDNDDDDEDEIPPLQAPGTTSLSSDRQNDITTFPHLPETGLEDLPHASPQDLDEKLAKMFLSSRKNLTDLAELEAFLESEDPSWPADTALASLRSDSSPQFDDNFNDFLPFQSAETAATTTSDSGETVSGEDLFPDEGEITSMQNTLFGSTSATTSRNEDSLDLGAQLHQLQWHAQRVRDIADPDKRRKEAALIALAFSVQWGTDNPAPSSAAPPF